MGDMLSLADVEYLTPSVSDMEHGILARGPAIYHEARDIQFLTWHLYLLYYTEQTFYIGTLDS